MEEQMQLQDIFLFQGIEHTISELKIPEPLQFSKGDIIYDASNYRKALGIILSGKAQAVSAGQEKAVMNTFFPGSVFGAAAIFGSEESYVSTIRALSNCTVQFLPQTELEALFLREPKAAMNYIRFLSSRVQLLNRKIAVLTQDDAASKLYRYLTDHCDEQGHMPALSMTKLAGILHIGRTSLYRAVAQLEEKHWITRSKSGDWEVKR